MLRDKGARHERDDEKVQLWDVVHTASAQSANAIVLQNGALDRCGTERLADGKLCALQGKKRD